ncbi:cytochrome P450, partial [Actinophytocola sp.]|uniref:cytochrome P450 n=1 Tax=Actinophytocola sp. TaxID=1872138 RepID=UPI002D4E9B62
MVSLRTRFMTWATRIYLARASKKGFDLSKMALLPDSALMPLKRDGLDPIPELGELRDREPVSKIPIPFGVNVWLVTGYEEAKTVLSDAKRYSNEFKNLVGEHGASASHSPGGLGFADPPDHTRLRKILTPEFTMRRLSRLTPGIKAIIDQQLDGMAAVDGPVDLVEHFALPIPSLVICELLGVPYDDRDDFQRLSMARFDLFGGATASLGAISESLAYLTEV